MYVCINACLCIYVRVYSHMHTLISHQIIYYWLLHITGRDDASLSRGL